MGTAIKAEVRKLLTTRLWWGMAIAVLAAGALLALLMASILNETPNPEQQAQGQPAMTPLQIATSTYTSGSAFGYVLLMVIGIMTIGSEYRHKTITGSLLAVPHRSRLIAAKVIALLAFGVLYGLIFLIGSVGAGATVLSIRGLEVFPEPGTLLRSLVLVLLVLGLWALIGLGLGVLITNQIAAILVGVGVAFIVEPLLGVLVSQVSWGESLAKYFPSRATNAVLQGYAQDGSTNQLSWWAGALVLIGYAAIMVAIGTFLTERRDVT
ncbi:ABC transporter permease subunit [Calidifontibacter sp. DB0510]|uniref:ABC transporter permease subunit n=1 Tax=Metallococcus carri TaxID=1656884 RepID=A0A967EAY9_9MICO|nr:ABC transporter permease subunit [Metallococcus carri]NHN56404.1 ABC transporter permease subunit [Metallococcus carri]NOP36028.1 ABC transporter permease subunit [Calidifontibacter sp. DB2511S]